VTDNISGYDIGIAQTTINRSKEEVITLYPPGHGPWYGVRLNSPENGTVDYDGNVMLVYTPTSPTAIPNCSLYSNLSGAFAYGWSDDTIHNDTTNSFAVIGAASGNYMWNVLCIINATPMFALENRTFTVNKTNNNSVVQNITTTANVPFEVNATNLNASVSITTSASVGDADMRVIVSLHDNTTRNTTIGVPGLNKIISIDASSEIANNLASAMLRLNYTHAEVAAAGLNETDMALWRYNETTHQWTALTNNTPGVYGTGVNTAADYVWANVSHFSDYAIAQASQTQQTTMTAGWNLISIPLII
jgi:hypothetical protein